MVFRTLALLLFVTGSASAQGPARVLDLSGRAVNPLIVEPGSVATVLVFITTDCPISNRYAPEIQRLESRFGQQVRFVLVFPVANDSAAVIRTHLKKFAFSSEAVRDTAQELVKHTGVTISPEVAVLDAKSQLVYRGRIDDRYLELGKDRPYPTVRDLERALEAVVAGKPVAVRETQAVGCILADLVK
ncbi:MAG: hypothetical protein Q7R30_04460 [Acidobacteriota bacterium]|nr:hypothetical protein [Acidobacteriota bacterium]